LIRSLTSLRGRVSSLEDRSNIALKDLSDEEKADRGQPLNINIEELKEKIKKLEDELRELKKKKNEIQVVEKADGSIDYMIIIEQVKEALEQDIGDLNQRVADLEN